MKNVKAKILHNKKIAPGRFLMSLAAPSVSRLAKPGQFLMVKCSCGTTPLLRRPFAFHRIRKDHFEVLYQVVGGGTEALSRKRPGEKIDIIGPLGNGFSPVPGRSPVLVAGGIAVAPLLALAESKEIRRQRPDVVIGAGSGSHILCVADFRKAGAKVIVATEDGSRGYKGMATGVLDRLLRKSGGTERAVYACGPRAMLREVVRLAKKAGAPCQVSLEEKMGCGTGVCRGCAVRTVTGYKMVCEDGPVFNGGDIIWRKG
jgi:dihydroorotate dehydrogenase electron transfer subunit